MRATARQKSRQNGVIQTGLDWTHLSVDCTSRSHINSYQGDASYNTTVFAADSGIDLSNESREVATKCWFKFHSEQLDAALILKLKAY